MLTLFSIIIISKWKKSIIIPAYSLKHCCQFSIPNKKNNLWDEVLYLIKSSVIVVAEDSISFDFDFDLNFDLKRAGKVRTGPRFYYHYRYSKKSIIILA